MITFLKHSLRNFQSTGAVVPSSQWLARDLASSLDDRSHVNGSGMLVLEAGAGTGALTQELVRKLRPEDHLTICEISDAFVDHLNKRFREDPALSPYRQQTTIHHGPVEELAEEGRFHHIVSGLPFNNFPPELVRNIVESLIRAAHPDGTISYFEYVGIRRFKHALAQQDERDRLDQIGIILAELTGHGSRRMTIRNLPPAWACTFKPRKNGQNENL